jgi:peptide/nickel transport system permease protein
MLNAVNTRDYPVIRGGVIILAATTSVVMLLVDLVYAVVDPRIKAQYIGKAGQ